MVDQQQGIAGQVRAIGSSVSDLESRIGYLLHRTDLLHMTLFRDILAPLGLTPARATAIGWVRQFSGSGQSDLARAMNVNRASAMEMVNHLVALDLIERRQGRNRRSNALFITEKGEEIYKQFLILSMEVDDIICSKLSNEEKNTLFDLLSKVNRGIQDNLSTEL